MQNTFRRRLFFIVLAAGAIWVFLWYTHTLVERLNRESRGNCQTIAMLWAGVQYPLSMVNDEAGLMSCSRCGHPLEAPDLFGSSSESLFCPVCGDTTLFIRTWRFTPAEREDIVEATRTLFSDVSDRLLFPTVFADRSGHPQIVDGRSTDGFQESTLLEIQQRMDELRRENEPVPLIVQNDTIGFLYYGSTRTGSEMKMMPFLELGLLLVAAAVIYLLLHSEIRSEKNMSWVGFARETAHQLSTPLSSLMGWLELLREEESVMKNTESAEAVFHMGADVGRLAAIADRYGQMGRKPRLTPLSVMEVIEETSGYFNVRKGLLGKGVTLEIENRCSTDCVLGNKALLGWVFENLIKNAAAACAGKNESSTIRISCENDPDDRRTVRILVSDDGIGIPYANQGKVFKAGFTTRKGGWGLGLSLAVRIIREYHSGTIRLVSSIPDKGSVFLIEIPLHRREDN